MEVMCLLLVWNLWFARDTSTQSVVGGCWGGGGGGLPQSKQARDAYGRKSSLASRRGAYETQEMPATSPTNTLGNLKVKRCITKANRRNFSAVLSINNVLSQSRFISDTSLYFYTAFAVAS